MYYYLLWDIGPTDWDKVYTDYMPLSEELDINNPKDTKRAYELFNELTSTLIDHHFSLTFSDFTVISPSSRELMSRDYYHDPISDMVRQHVRNNYNGSINVA